MEDDAPKSLDSPSLPSTSSAGLHPLTDAAPGTTSDPAAHAHKDAAAAVKTEGPAEDKKPGTRIFLAVVEKLCIWLCGVRQENKKWSWIHAGVRRAH